MRAADAVNTIRGMIFAPDVEIRAGQDYSGQRFFADEQVIYCEITFRTFDSSTPTEDGRYLNRRTIAPTFTLDVAGIGSEDELVHEVLRYLAAARQHEDREFTRVRRDGRWTAPFHPHNQDTDLAWHQAEVDAERRRGRIRA